MNANRHGYAPRSVSRLETRVAGSPGVRSTTRPRGRRASALLRVRPRRSLLCERCEQTLQVLGTQTACVEVSMYARELLARVVACSKQLGVDVQHLHGRVTASVARIGPQKCVEPSPMIFRLTTRLVLHVVNHVSSLVDPRPERLAGVRQEPTFALSYRFVSDAAPLLTFCLDAVGRHDYSPCWLFSVVSVCGLRAAITVNRVAMSASEPYPRAICGSEKVLESCPAMRAGIVAPL
jgi:hypothetical protein